MNIDNMIIEIKELNNKMEELNELIKTLPDNISFPKTVTLTPHVELPKDVFNHTQVDKMITQTGNNNKLIKKFTEIISDYEKQIKAFKDEITKEKTQKVSLDSNEIKIINTDDLKAKEVAIKQADDIIKAIKSIKQKYPEVMKVYQELEPYTYTITRDNQGKVVRYTEIRGKKTIIETIQRDNQGKIIGGKVEVK